MDFLINIGPLLLIFVVFYFFFIRPQAKKQKEQNQFVQAISKGDEVVTSSGIIGRISKTEDQVITLQIDTKTFIRILRSSISKELTDAYQKNGSSS